jgi:hypothetical protein
VWKAFSRITIQDSSDRDWDIGIPEQEFLDRGGNTANGGFNQKMNEAADKRWEDYMQAKRMHKIAAELKEQQLQLEAKEKQLEAREKEVSVREEAALLEE